MPHFPSRIREYLRRHLLSVKASCICLTVVPIDESSPLQVCSAGVEVALKLAVSGGPLSCQLQIMSGNKLLLSWCFVGVDVQMLVLLNYISIPERVLLTPSMLQVRHFVNQASCWQG